MEETKERHLASRLQSKEGKAQHFFKSLSLYTGRTTNFSKPRAQGEAQNISKSQSLGRSSGVEFFQVLRPIYRGRIRNFSKSQRLYEGAAARNFSKSQDSYRYGSAKSNISTYFFILLHIFYIFLHIFHMFLHISSYRHISFTFSTYYFFIFLHISYIWSSFLHIYCIKEFPNVTSSGCQLQYIDIFLHIFHIFLHISFIFLHIFHIFLHISSQIVIFPSYFTASRNSIRRRRRGESVLANPEITPQVQS